MSSEAYVSSSTINYGSEDLLQTSMKCLQEKQAEVFLQDAEDYRSIQHKITPANLIIYRILVSLVWGGCLTLSIVCLHGLAFLEPQSSLSLSSYINQTYTAPPPVTVPPALLFTLEALFLLFILADSILQAYLFGMRKSLKNPWLVCLFVLMLFSWIDMFISIGLGNVYTIRVRRFFRPFIAIQKSQLMKKMLKSLSKTIVDILSAFALLFVWLFAFSLIAISIFSSDTKTIDSQYKNFYDAFFTLLILTTTANNPDAMVRVYNDNRFSFLFFLIFMVIGIFVFMNVLVAIIFNEFRGHVLDSMQTSRFRRRIAIRALYEVLRKTPNKCMTISHTDEVNADALRRVIQNSSLSQWKRKAMLENLDSLGSDDIDWDNLNFVVSPMDDHKEDRKVYNIPRFSKPWVSTVQSFLLSKSFEIVGLVLCAINVIVITVDVSVENSQKEIKAKLFILNWIFVILYIFEQIAKFVAMGATVYFSKRGCIYDFIITLAIFVMKIVEVSFQHFSKRPLFGAIYLSDLSRLTNLVIMLRAARLVQLLPTLAPIISTLFDIPWRMKSVIGVLMLLFYEYALLGMILFHDAINPDFLRNQTDCGQYEQLMYGGINFNDFFSSVVVLWCLLIVNNWQVFVTTFSKAKNTKFVHIYMISWWVIVVIVVMNCVTAFVIEAYTQRKAFYEEERVKRIRKRSVSNIVDNSVNYLRQSVVVNESFTFQMLFKNDLLEPTEEELMTKLKRCDFLCAEYPHIAHSRCDN